MVLYNVCTRKKNVCDISRERHTDTHIQHSHVRRDGTRTSRVHTNCAATELTKARTLSTTEQRARAGEKSRGRHYTLRRSSRRRRRRGGGSVAVGAWRTTSTRLRQRRRRCGRAHCRRAESDSAATASTSNDRAAARPIRTRNKIKNHDLP